MSELSPQDTIETALRSVIARSDGGTSERVLTGWALAYQTTQANFESEDRIGYTLGYLTGSDVDPARSTGLLSWAAMAVLEDLR